MLMHLNQAYDEIYFSTAPILEFEQQTYITLEGMEANLAVVLDQPAEMPVTFSLDTTDITATG